MKTEDEIKAEMGRIKGVLDAQGTPDYYKALLRERIGALAWVLGKHDTILTTRRKIENTGE